MGFLRRLFGSGPPAKAPLADPVDKTAGDADERQHELDMLRNEQERLDDLAQRQLRYARYAWQPPRQGGERRADDLDEPRT